MAERYPQTPASTNAALAMQLRKLEQDMRDMRSNLLRAAGLQAEPELLRVLGSLVVEGDLSVPNGSISNDALSNPTTYRSSYGTETPIAYTTSAVPLALNGVTTPTGYTEATVTAFATCKAYNQTGSTQYVYVRMSVRRGSGYTEWSGYQQFTLPAGFQGTGVAPLLVAFSDLAEGETIECYADVLASAALISDASQWVSAEMAITYTR